MEPYSVQGTVIIDSNKDFEDETTKCVVNREEVMLDTGYGQMVSSGDVVGVDCSGNLETKSKKKSEQGNEYVQSENLYTKQSDSFHDTQPDYMLAENVGVNATFYIDGGYSVYKGADGNWYVSIAVSGHTPNSRNGDAYFRGGVNMTVDGKITQQLPLVVPDGPAIGPAKYQDSLLEE